MILQYIRVISILITMSPLQQTLIVISKASPDSKDLREKFRSARVLFQSLGAQSVRIGPPRQAWAPKSPASKAAWGGPAPFIGWCDGVGSDGLSLICSRIYDIVLSWNLLSNLCVYFV